MASCHAQDVASDDPVYSQRGRRQADDLIAMHYDHLDFWRWSRQALGTPGLLLGWTPFLKAKVRTQAGANLQKILASKSCVCRARASLVPFFGLYAKSRV